MIRCGPLTSMYNMYGSTKGTKTCFEVGQCFEVQTQDQHVCHMPRLRGGEMFETPTEHSWSDHELTACGIMNMEEKPLGPIQCTFFCIIPGNKFVFVRLFFESMRLNFVFGIRKYLPSHGFLSSINKFALPLFGHQVLNSSLFSPLLPKSWCIMCMLSCIFIYFQIHC